jgi:hypothetical protein
MPSVHIAVLRADATWKIHFKWPREERGLQSGFSQIRLKRRMSRERFAEPLDISVDFLSLIEAAGMRPRSETVDKVAKCPRVPALAHLFDRR